MLRLAHARPPARALGPVARALGPVARALGPVALALGPVVLALGPVALVLGLVLGLGGGWSCKSSSPSGPSGAREPLAGLQELSVPNARGAETPALARVGAADDPGARLKLSYVADAGSPSEARLLLSELGDGAFAAPEEIARGEDLLVNWADFAGVSVDDGATWAHWLRSGGARGAYGIELARRDASAGTWARLGPPHQDGTASEHGFVTHLPEAGGEHRVVWLDGRGFAPGGNERMALMTRALGPSGFAGPEEVLDEDVCTCCQTDGVVASTRAGPVPLVVYRDRSEANVRDISILRRVAGQWSAPLRVAADDWTIAGCPVNGPAIDAQGDTVVVAWFSGAQAPGRVSLVWSTDAGASFSAPVRVDAGEPIGRVDVALIGANEAALSFLEHPPPGSAGADLLVRAVDQKTGPGPLRRVATTDPSPRSGFPRMVRLDDRLVFAWTEVGEDDTRVRVATAPLASLRASG